MTETSINKFVFVIDRIRRSNESYLLEKSLNWLLRRAYNCLQQEKEIITDLTLNDLFGSFVILAIGFICSFVAFLAEITNSSLVKLITRRRQMAK